MDRSIDRSMKAQFDSLALKVFTTRFVLFTRWNIGVIAEFALRQRSVIYFSVSRSLRTSRWAQTWQQPHRSSVKPATQSLSEAYERGEKNKTMNMEETARLHVRPDIWPDRKCHTVSLFDHGQLSRQGQKPTRPRSGEKPSLWISGNTTESSDDVYLFFFSENIFSPTISYPQENQNRRRKIRAVEIHPN